MAKIIQIVACDIDETINGKTFTEQSIHGLDEEGNLYYMTRRGKWEYISDSPDGLSTIKMDEE